jgi:hypothetical protein
VHASDTQPQTRLSLLALLRRSPALPAAEVILQAWLRASGWTYDPASPRFPWADPEGIDSHTLRDAVRAQAQLTAARLLRKRGWTVSAVGPGVGLGPGWARPPHSRREVTLTCALRCEGIDAVYLSAGAPLGASSNAP